VFVSLLRGTRAPGIVGVLCLPNGARIRSIMGKGRRRGSLNDIVWIIRRYPRSHGVAFKAGRRKLASYTMYTPIAESQITASCGKSEAYNSGMCGLRDVETTLAEVPEGERDLREPKLQHASGNESSVR
jgi:hypothetical protein